MSMIYPWERVGKRSGQPEDEELPNVGGQTDAETDQQSVLEDETSAQSQEKENQREENENENLYDILPFYPISDFSFDQEWSLWRVFRSKNW